MIFPTALIPSLLWYKYASQGVFAKSSYLKPRGTGPWNHPELDGTYLQITEGSIVDFFLVDITPHIVSGLGIFWPYSSWILRLGSSTLSIWTGHLVLLLWENGTKGAGALWLWCLADMEIWIRLQTSLCYTSTSAQREKKGPIAWIASCPTTMQTLSRKLISFLRNNE
jgi:hypothetical protein